MNAILNKLKSFDDFLNLPYFDFVACLGFFSLHPGGIRRTKNLVHQLNIKPTDKILEIGSGVGATTVGLLRAGGDVTIVEPNQSLLETTVRNCKVFANKTPHTYAIGAEDLSDLVHETFDIVIMEAVFGFIQDKQKALNGIFSLLKPGGRIGITDWIFAGSLKNI